MIFIAEAALLQPGSNKLNNKKSTTEVDRVGSPGP